MAAARADLTREVMARHQRFEQAVQPSSHAVGWPGLDAELVQVDAVLRVVGELAQLLHPLPDEVVHGALVRLRLHAEEGVHGGQVVAQLSDLAADAGEQLVLFAQALPNIANKGLRRALHSRVGSQMARLGVDAN